MSHPLTTRFPELSRETPPTAKTMSSRPLMVLLPALILTRWGTIPLMSLGFLRWLKIFA
jgi:hypothetical protein